MGAGGGGGYSHEQQAAHNMCSLSRGRAGRSLTQKKQSVPEPVFPKKSPRALHVLNHGWWRLAVGGWRLAVGGGWRLAVDGSWRLAVGGPLGRSLRGVLSKKKKNLVP